MGRYGMAECEEWPPPKPKPLNTRSVPDSACPLGFHDKVQSINTGWMSPFIYGMIFGFGICLIIFEIMYQ